MEPEVIAAVGHIIPKIAEWGLAVLILFSVVVVQAIVIKALYSRNVYIGDEMMKRLDDANRVMTEVRDAIRYQRNS